MPAMAARAWQSHRFSRTNQASHPALATLRRNWLNSRHPADGRDPTTDQPTTTPEKLARRHWIFPHPLTARPWRVPAAPICRGARFVPCAPAAMLTHGRQRCSQRTARPAAARAGANGHRFGSTTTRPCTRPCRMSSARRGRSCSPASTTMPSSLARSRSRARRCHAARRGAMGW
jgi:hypothetical protein